MLKDIMYGKMQRHISQIPNFYQLSPQELEQQTQISAHDWREFLETEPVRQLIHRRATEDIEVAQRKAMGALAKAAQHGNVSAIKELNQLSGILNQNNNKQFITHYIPRPPQTQEVEHENNNMPTL